jgi:hypothetical protein
VPVQLALGLSRLAEARHPQVPAVQEQAARAFLDRQTVVKILYTGKKFRTYHEKSEISLLSAESENILSFKIIILILFR